MFFIYFNSFIVYCECIVTPLVDSKTFCAINQHVYEYDNKLKYYDK